METAVKTSLFCLSALALALWACEPEEVPPNNGGNNGGGLLGGGGGGNPGTVTDFSAPGPYDAVMIEGTGPDGNYTLFRPDRMLGSNGFKHPIGTWGNGILTIPNEYEQTLELIASHGFVIIGCNDIMAEMACMDAGLTWLAQQNSVPGPMQGKLDTSSEFTIGYSWGGGAAIDTARRPNVKTTVSLHGMPPRELDAFFAMHAPLLLFSSTGDSFVTADTYVTPNYEQSQVQTFYALLDNPNVDHLYIVDEGASSCAASLALGDCGSAMMQRAPTIAWLRMWLYGDQNARAYFYGDSCTLCRSPWISQRKNWF
jgi:hypothetical protein